MSPSAASGQDIFPDFDVYFKFEKDLGPMCPCNIGLGTDYTSAWVGAQSGLRPGPGWGPVRVGAHMGPYGPLCFFEQGYVSGSDGSV